MEELNKELLLDLYHSMVRIRMFEERVRDLALKNEIPGFVHVSIGEEASATGVCLALRHTDRITSTHRGHGHLIAKGGRLDRMMAELFGKRTGYCKGKGGSMHIVDFTLGILGANGIVGAGLPIATGSALAAVIAGRDDVTACFFGDGASNEGTFHESLNLAAVWKLPVIFVCENNGFGEFTPAQTVTSVRDIAVRHVAEVNQLADEYLGARDGVEHVSAEELQERLARGDVVVLDVRPEPEFQAGHIPGARSVPLDALASLAPKLPRRHQIVAYCRGPYCVYADDAVRLLQARGLKARRLDVGFPEWRRAGLPIETG